MDDRNGNERLHLPAVKVTRDSEKESRGPSTKGNVPQRSDTAAVPQEKSPVDIPGLQSQG